jgi:hypothetical protein
VKHRLLVEKDRGNASRKNQEKKRAVFFWRIFLEVSVFTAPAVRITQILTAPPPEEVSSLCMLVRST